MLRVPGWLAALAATAQAEVTARCHSRPGCACGLPARQPSAIFSTWSCPPNAPSAAWRTTHCAPNARRQSAAGRLCHSVPRPPRMPLWGCWGRRSCRWSRPETTVMPCPQPSWPSRTTAEPSLRLSCPAALPAALRPLWPRKATHRQEAGPCCWFPYPAPARVGDAGDMTPWRCCCGPCSGRAGCPQGYGLHLSLASGPGCRGAGATRRGWAARRGAATCVTL